MRRKTLFNVPLRIFWIKNLELLLLNYHCCKAACLAASNVLTEIPP